MKTLFLFLVLGAVFVVQAQTSKDNPRLQEALKRFPEADTNKDGVLTMSEAKKFKEEMAQRKDAGQDRETDKPSVSAEAPEGSERQVYKKVGQVELSLYVFKPKGHSPDSKVPAIVFYHGGAWRTGDPKQFEKQCKYLADRGMVAVTVEYRLRTQPEVRLEDCIEDAKSAFRWVREHASVLGVDPNRIASGGGSAGGHLAACTELIDDFDAKVDNCNVSAKPNAMVLFNPFLGLAPAQMTDKDMGKNLTRGTVEKCMPLTYASAKQPPCIMFFGTLDKYLEGAKLYQQESVKAGNECTIVTYEGEGHGFFRNAKYYELTVAEMDKFLVKLGWLKEK